MHPVESRIKTESFEFNRRLTYAEPLTISMPRNLHKVTLKIEFPKGLFQEVTRETRMGARRKADIAEIVEFNIYANYHGWKFKRLAQIRACERYEFNEPIDLQFRGPTMYVPPTDIRIVRETFDSEYSKLCNETWLKGMTVVYEPSTRTTIIKAAAKTEIP